MRDWDDAFDNMGHVEGSASLPARWSERAAAYRRDRADSIACDIPYGPGARQIFDLVSPDGSPKGLVVFVHGGYWMRLDKSMWTDMAEGARTRGYAVALPSYTLAPQARIRDITVEIAQAIGAAARRVDGPIHLAGHSAGGHLVSRMVTVDSPLDPYVADRIDRTVSISGLHDLRPLLFTRMNATLRLTPEEAAAESPALLAPRADVRLTCWVGGAERPEFIRQSQLMGLMWDGLGARTAVTVEPGHNHFTIVDGLMDADSRLVQALLGS